MSVNIVEEAAGGITDTDELLFVKFATTLLLTDTLTVLAGDVLTDILITFQRLQLYLD